jgi:uncharacterized phage protein gp47/JayE
VHGRWSANKSSLRSPSTVGAALLQSEQRPPSQTYAGCPRKKAGSRGVAKGARVEPTSNAGTQVGVQLPTAAGLIILRLRTSSHKAPEARTPYRPKQGWSVAERLLRVGGCRCFSEGVSAGTTKASVTSAYEGLGRMRSRPRVNHMSEKANNNRAQANTASSTSNQSNWSASMLPFGCCSTIIRDLPIVVDLDEPPRGLGSSSL